MTRSHSSRGSKPQESAKAPSPSSLDGKLPESKRVPVQEIIRVHQEAVASLERFSATLPTLSTIVTTIDARRREELSRILSEGLRLAEVERRGRRAIQRVSLSKQNRAEVSRTTKKGHELGRRIIDLSERAEQLFDAGGSIPLRPEVPAARDEVDLCEAMVRHRNRFWTALHMVPFVREHSLRELDRVRNGDLKASLAIVTKRSENKSEAQLTRHVRANAQTVRGMLERNDWNPGLLNSAKIATLLIEVPLTAEKQALLMKDLSSRTKELRELGDRLTQRHGSVSNLAAQRDPDYELFVARTRELGGGVEHAEVQCRVLGALREPYHRIKDYLVNSNIGLVGRVVSSHERVLDRQEELMQDGVLGLMRAIEKFDPEMGLKLSTIATWWIAQAILRHRPNYQAPISLPSHQMRALGMVHKADAEQRSLSNAELAEKLDLRPDVVEALRTRLRGMKSLSSSFDEVSSLGERIEDPRDETVLSTVGKRELGDRIRAMLARMEPRSAEVLRLRFGLDGDPLTLEQIAQRFSVTRERIRQIEAKALNKIRSGHLRKSLEGFVD